MSWPTISVLIPTYKRPWILRKVLEGLKKNIVYSGTVKYYIGFDGDGTIAKMFSGDSSVIAIPGPNRGLGANLNRLIQNAASDYLFQLDDDHLLVESICLNQHIRKLEYDETVGWIRLMGIAYHDYIATLEEQYWRVWWKSPELYIPSNRPHLKHRRFHEHFGLYPEDVLLGETEIGFCRQCKEKRGGPFVLIPLDVATESSWEHIGESWQGKGC